MKRISFVCGVTAWLALSPLSAVAAAIDAVVVWKSAGDRMVVLLDERPQVLFSGEDVIVQTVKNRIVLPVGEVKRFTYESVSPSGVNGLHAGDVQVSLSDGQLRLTAQKAGLPVGLYGADGRLLQSVTAGSDGTAEMDISRFPSGTYIIKTSTGNFKITKP